MILIRETSLEGGVLVRFYDQSNRYFGDYNRVSILVSVTSRNDPEGGYQQVLDHMAVPSHDITTVRNMMIENYLATTKTYLTKSDFLKRAALHHRKKAQPKLYG